MSELTWKQMHEAAVEFQADLQDKLSASQARESALREKILELEQRVKVLTDGLQKISSIGKGIGNMMAKDLLNQTVLGAKRPGKD